MLLYLFFVVFIYIVDHKSHCLHLTFRYVVVVGYVDGPHTCALVPVSFEGQRRVCRMCDVNVLFCEVDCVAIITKLAER